MALPYPKEFPSAEISTIVEIVKNGQIVERKEEFANCAWHVQGFIQGVIIGDPSSYAAQSEIDVIEVLEKLASGENDEASQAVIPWREILEWLIKLLLELITK